MPLTDLRISTYSADLVAVYEAKSFNQVFASGRPIKAAVSENSKTMEHPLETGAVVADHRIINPVEIELSLLFMSADYRSGYQLVKQLYLSGTLLTVQTKTSTYENMLIQDMPHDEDPEMYDAIAIAVRMKEVRFTQAQFGSLSGAGVADKSKASTVQKGEQLPTSANDGQTKKASILYGIFH